MNIFNKQLSKQVSLVVLLSLPCTPSLQAAGWFDAVCNSPIGQWFSSQSKIAQISFGVGALATMAAVYYGYRSLAPNSIISLSAVNINQLDGYRIYAFGTELGMLEKDIDDVTSVLKESDTSICPAEEKRFLFPSGYLFERKHFVAFGSDRELKVDALIEGINIFIADSLFFTETQIDIMRDSKDKFVGFLLSGVCLNESQRTYILFVAPEFRRCGCAKKILHHHAGNLLAQGITEVSFSAFKKNPACKWYDAFGFKKQDTGNDSWKYSGTITQ